jgi:hypothetical protein
MSRHASQEADVGAVLWRDPCENQPNAGRIPPTAPPPFSPTPWTPRHQGSNEGGLNSPGQRSDSQSYETVSWVGEMEVRSERRVLLAEHRPSTRSLPHPASVVPNCRPNGGRPRVTCVTFNVICETTTKCK